MGLLLEYLWVQSLITRGVVFPKRDYVASTHPWSVVIDLVKNGFYTYIIYLELMSFSLQARLKVKTLKSSESINDVNCL